MSTKDSAKWSNLTLNTPYKYGDRITLGGSQRQGVVMGFIGKKKESIIVRFDDNHGQSVSVKKSDVIELSRKD